MSLAQNKLGDYLVAGMDFKCYATNSAANLQFSKVPRYL